MKHLPDPGKNAVFIRRGGMVKKPGKSLVYICRGRGKVNTTLIYIISNKLSIGFFIKCAM